MGISERKEREKMEMRSLILKEATRMFIEEGFEKASIRNIAERIEYSPATIYLYFKDKDEILFAIHEQGFDILLREMNKTAKITEPFERFCKVAEVYMKFAHENPEYYDLMFIIRSPMNKLSECDSKWTCGFECYQVLKDIIQDCIDAKVMKPMNIDYASISVWAFMHGLVSLSIRDRFKMYPDEVVQDLINGSVNLMKEMYKA